MKGNILDSYLKHKSSQNLNFNHSPRSIYKTKYPEGFFFFFLEKQIPRRLVSLTRRLWTIIGHSQESLVLGGPLK